MRRSTEWMYTLDDHGEPVPCPDIHEWGRWMQSAERHVAATDIGEVLVSTVFLGLDHSFFSGGPPVLWESMVFGGPMDGTQRRYTSRLEAELGHRELTEEAWACLQ